MNAPDRDVLYLLAACANLDVPNYQRFLLNSAADIQELTNILMKKEGVIFPGVRNYAISRVDSSSDPSPKFLITALDMIDDNISHDSDIPRFQFQITLTRS